MQLWRISEFTNLTGDGGIYASGRWHNKGRRVVYLADHPASALIEVLVHLEIDVEDLPTHYQLLTVDVPDDVAITTISENNLPTDWRGRLAVTRRHGDEWYRSGTTALLRIPSAIVPVSNNFLLNPIHPESARIRIAASMRAPFDPRLLRFAQ